MEIMYRGLDAIITPVNAVWLCVAGGFFALCVPIWLLLRKKEYDKRRKALLAIAIANLGLFLLYLLWFQYIPGQPYFRWSILPVNLCNLVTILLVVALATDTKWLYGFCFYVGTVAGIAAILSPEGGLKEMELFSPLMIGFYFVHCMLYTLGISLVTLKLYRPDYRSALLAVLQLEILAVIMYVVNLVLRQTVYPEANFFFLFSADGSPYLEALHSLVPVPPFTMMVSVLPVAVGSFLLLTLIYRVAAGRPGKASAGKSPWA